MSTRKKRWLATLVVAVGLGIFGFRAACNAINPCGNSVIDTVRSPNKDKSLIVFVRNCGATTSFSTQVSLIDSDDELPNEAGNLFIIDVPGSDVSGSLYMNPVGVEWESGSKATVTYPAKSKIYKQIVKSDGVALTYMVE